MAYEQLKAAISSVIKQNDNSEITGNILQQTLLNIVSVIGANATFAGLAFTSTNPGNIDQNVFYIAVDKGTYANFNGINLMHNGFNILYNKSGNWQLYNLIDIPEELGTGSRAIISQKFSTYIFQKKTAFIFNSTENMCLDVNDSVWYIPQGIKIFIPGLLVYTVLTNTTIAKKVPGSLESLFFNTTTNTFESITFSDMNNMKNNGNMLIADHVGGQMRINSTYFKINSIVYKNSVGLSELATNYNATAKNFTRFFDNIHSITDPVLIKTATAVKNIKIYTTDNTWEYYIVAVKQPETPNDMFIMYSYDNNGNTGIDVRIGMNHIRYLYGKVWIAKVVANGVDDIEIVFDHEASGYFANIIQLKISRSCYIKKFESGGSSGGGEVNRLKDKIYCSLGASVSTGLWHIAGVSKLEMKYTKFGVNNARWGCIYDNEALDYTGTNNNNNNMMNQVARLYKSFDDTAYNPHVITVMCGIDGAITMASENYLDAFNNVNLTGLTPTNWFTNAPLNYRKSFCISMRACLEFLSTKFPKSQLIIMTPQLTNSLAYDVSKNMTKNLIGIANFFAIPVIDFFYESGISDISGTLAVFSTDGLLPNTAGAYLFTNFIEQQLKTKIMLRR